MTFDAQQIGIYLSVACLILAICSIVLLFRRKNLYGPMRFSDSLAVISLPPTHFLLKILRKTEPGIEKLVSPPTKYVTITLDTSDQKKKVAILTVRRGRENLTQSINLNDRKDLQPIFDYLFGAAISMKPRELKAREKV